MMTSRRSGRNFLETRIHGWQTGIFCVCEGCRDSDSFYHRLFAHPGMVIDLLMAFLDPAILAELDLNGLQWHNTKFTAMLGQRRRSDVVWEIPTRQGASIFLLLILEFQSEVEEWMALRVDVYTGLLYQQLVDERQLKAHAGLPPVLPIILYNGEPRWNAATSVRDLIRLPQGTSLWNFQPEMRYCVMDEGGYPKEVLEKLPYLTAILCRMEHPASPEDLVRAGQDVVVWFEKHPDGPPVKKLFCELLIAGLTRMKVDPLPNIPEELQEVVVMLAARVEKWAMEYEQKGIQIGEERGEQRGRQKEASAMLLKLLRRKFDQTPDWVDAKVKSASLELIEILSENFVFANSIDDVFAS